MPDPVPNPLADRVPDPAPHSGAPHALGALDALDALDALGDANRRAILEILAGGPTSVQQIADQLPVSRPAVSRHLRLLKSAGLVRDESLGTRRVYALHGEGVEAIARYFSQVWGEAAARFRIAAENLGPADPADD